MERIEKAVSNSGPLIHLAQIDSFDVLSIINHIYIPQEVFNEVSFYQLAKDIRKSRIIEVKQLGSGSKDFAKLISEEYSLDLGEAEAISVAEQEDIKLFLTDDLAARIVAKRIGLEPHGTIGIVLRAFKIGFIKKERAIKLVDDLQKKSSLFLTSDLVDYIIREIEKS